MRSLTLLSSSLSFLEAFGPPDKCFDLDGNGTPDLCTTNSDETASCLLSSVSLSTFKTSTYRSGMLAISKTATATGTSPAPRVTGTLPDPTTFKKENGTKWSIEYVGNVGFTDVLKAKWLEGDKCRWSKLGNKGPPLYGTSSVMTVNKTGVKLVRLESSLPIET
ncbi:hypothetical protein B0H19DRAFT_1376142 [Mycena capillaripes]|nr:hypothetical protein B0H19DRAFT_1376142 [Mycena capillaripes]